MGIADIAPLSSLLLIMDRSVGQLPESMAGGWSRSRRRVWRLGRFRRTTGALG